jgi:hypothetical protein
MKEAWLQRSQISRLYLVCNHLLPKQLDGLFLCRITYCDIYLFIQLKLYVCMYVCMYVCFVSELYKVSSPVIDPRTVSRSCGLYLYNFLFETSNFGLGADLVSCLVSEVHGKSRTKPSGVRYLTSSPKLFPFHSYINYQLPQETFDMS